MSVGGVSLPAAGSVRSRRRRQARWWVRWVTPVGLVVLWVAVSAAGRMPTRFFPSAFTVAETGWQLIVSGELQQNLVISLIRVAIGLSLGVLLGGTLALVAGLSSLGRDAIDPVVQAVRTLPALALVPLFIVWFGIGETVKVAMIVFATAIPIYLNLYAGIRATDPKLIEAARTLRLSRAALIGRVVLPGAMGSFLVGLRFASGIAWLVLVVCEQINATTGIGAMMETAEDFLRTDIIVVGLIVYAVLGLATDYLVRLLERWVLAWR